MAPVTSALTTSLLLVRHGQSTWNADGRWQGQADPPLSEFGREQAFQASARVGVVDMIAASPQQRAHDTAIIISDQIGVGPVVVMDGLRERSAGPWSGLRKDEIEVSYPGFLDEGRRPDGYESDEALLARSEAVLEALVQTLPGATILVVAHGGVIHNFEQHLGIEVGRVPNLGGRVVHHENGEWTPGEPMQLLDDEFLTGGQSDRI